MAKTRSAARQKRHQRIRKHLAGTPEVPRLAVFKSLNEIYAQVIDDENGVTLASASTIDKELRTKMSKLKKQEQAELVGETVAKRAQDSGIKKVVFDRGGFRYMGRVKGLAEGARKAGLEF